MITRADKIYDVIRNNGERLRVYDIRTLLAAKERISDIKGAVISATVRADNMTKTLRGKVPRFNIYGDGNETHGYVSIQTATEVEKNLHGILKNSATQIPALVEQANKNVRKKIREMIINMTWKEFETNFLLSILESLGFNSITLTRPSHDGGKDALCVYRRGIVESSAIVSAKHFKKNVGVAEVQRVRGISENADSAVIITSSDFSKAAKKEAKVVWQNHRSVVLVNLDLIVETCIDNEILITQVPLPKLFKIQDNNSDEDFYT